MIVGGKEYEMYMDDIPVKDLEADFDQPRRYEIKLELERKGLDPKKAKTAEGIELARRFEELMGAIIENEGISMPLVVEKVNGHYKIIDGDRRLGAVKSILSDEKILKERPALKQRLAKLPCLVIKGPLSKEDKLRLLAHIHIHLADWRPVAKQKVIMDLRQLVEDEKVAAVMGVTPGSIAKTAVIDEMAKKFPSKGPAAISYARELLGIRKDLLDKEVIEATAKKVEEGKITSPVRMRTDLREILADSDAREVYLKPTSTIENAENVLKAKEFRKSLEAPLVIDLEELLSRLLTSLKNVRFDVLKKYKGDKKIKETVDNTITLLNEFKSYL